MIEERLLELENEVRELKQDVNEIKITIKRLDEKLDSIAVNELNHVKSEIRAIRHDLIRMFSWKYKITSDLVTAVIVVAVLLLLKLGGV